MPILKTRRNPGKRSYVLPPEKLAQREAAFVIYRDMGSRRSLVALHSKLKRDHPEIAVSRPSLEKWSKIHQWVERVRADDKSVSAVPPPPAEFKVDPNFNQIDALLTAANKALTRAMNAAPIVTKPSDVKALVDAAANALKLIETIRNQSVGKVSREEVAQEMARVLGEIEKVRLADLENRVDAELRKLGITRSGEGVTVESAAPVVAVDPDEAAIIDAEPEIAAVVQENQTKGTGLRLFVDVLAELRGRQNDDPEI